MAKIILQPSQAKERVEAAHRAEASEGEAARRLLEEHGYPVHRKSNNQYTFRCPFHEGQGKVAARKQPNFYLNARTSQYHCKSAACGERGNLQTLERLFGVEGTLTNPQFVSKARQLEQFEAALTPDKREVFYRQGLNDETIERFRFGWDEMGRRWVIPYLEGRHPIAFRFYNPHAKAGEPKYYWESGTSSSLYNATAGVGDDDGRVIVAEGELKVALFAQWGYAAVGVPGAGQWKDEWTAALTNARDIYVCFDNDNPNHHIYEQCAKCGPQGCHGHNPGQEAALQLVERLGWRAHNVLLPLPEGERKTDINEFVIRDGHMAADFAELAFGEKKTPYVVRTLSEIFEDPPEATEYIVAHGILPVAGRLLVTGAPKTGKSILMENMALSIAAGIPFLGRFDISEPTRTLLLDRELSKRALYERFRMLIEARPGYAAAMDNLCVDHDIMFKLDRKPAGGEAGPAEVLTQLIRQNGVQVVFLDTAYKFFSGNFTDTSISKAFEVIDEVIAKTGAAFVLSHHHRKRSNQDKKDNVVGDSDDVVGSFLWTGWPNGTVMLNFLERSVENPFNTVCSFTSFRDDAPPEPLALYRDRDTIAYKAIQDYRPDEDGSTHDFTGQRPTVELLETLLLTMQPIIEEDFLHAAAAKFGVKVTTIRPLYLDLLSRGNFEKTTSGRNKIVRFKDVQEETWEESQGIAPPDPLDWATAPLFGEDE